MRVPVRVNAISQALCKMALWARNVHFEELRFAWFERAGMKRCGRDVRVVSRHISLRLQSHEQLKAERHGAMLLSILCSLAP